MTRLLRHLQVLFDTLGRMYKTPLPTLMTLMMLGIAMALPLVLHKVVDSVAAAAAQWQHRPQISLFLNPPPNAKTNGEMDAAAIEFGRRLLRIPAIEDIDYISPSDALADFKRVSGFGAALDNLPENPLPPLLVVFPDPTQSLAQIETLVSQLSGYDEVESAGFDQLWLQRLRAILDLFKRGVAVLSALMAVGVVLIISNTVRLGIAARIDEIDIIDQVGGTRAFIRRPFLYFGALQGLFGALLGCVIANIGLFLLGRPVARLAALYGGEFSIQWLDLSLIGGLLGVAAVLGWAAAHITVDWRLAEKYHLS